MRKKELLKLKRIYATDTMMRTAKQKNCKYKLFVRCQSRGRLYMICVFRQREMAKGIRIPMYEIYCNKEGREYLTADNSNIIFNRNDKAVKWSSAMIYNISGFYNELYGIWPRDEKKKSIWQSNEGKTALQHWFETKENGIFAVYEWQQKTKDAKRDEAEAREQIPWDADMKLIPKMPETFEDWMDREGMRNHYIIYEYQGGKAKTGYCTHCKHDVPVIKPRHNVEDSCPHCKAKIQYKVSSKILTLTTDSFNCQIIQRIKDGIVIRTFEQVHTYRQGNAAILYRQPKKYISEIERVMLLDDGKVKRYYYGLYKNKKHRWCQDKGYVPMKKTYWRTTSTKLYKRNFTGVKKCLKNTALDMWEELPCGVSNYLEIEKGNPAIEKLAKLKMFILAKDLMRTYYDVELMDQDATELTKMLKIDKSRLDRLAYMGGGVKMLRWLQLEKKANTIWSDAMMYEFAAADIEPATEYEICEIKMSLVKAYNYLKKQMKITNEDMRGTERTWEDYLNMAKKAKYNLVSDMVYKPKDLKAAHTEVIMILQQGSMEREAKNLKKKWPKVEKNLKDIQKYEYEYGDYCIIAPKSMLDIVKEGTALMHCVHTCDFYFDRIQKKETYLLFLRKKETKDIPWYTLEVEPSGNIRQKRTTGDNQEKDFDLVTGFLKKYQKQLTKKLTKEEKELGAAADAARKRELEELRKNGNKIWHGKLAGQLLADVLEADFMAASF